MQAGATKPTCSLSRISSPRTNATGRWSGGIRPFPRPYPVRRQEPDQNPRAPTQESEGRSSGLAPPAPAHIASEGGKVTVFAPHTDYFKARQAILDAFGEVDFEVDDIQFVPQSMAPLGAEDQETLDKFPLDPGQTRTARIEVTSVRDDKPICTLLTEVRNGNGDICLTGSATTYTMPLKP